MRRLLLDGVFSHTMLPMIYYLFAVTFSCRQTIRFFIRARKLNTIHRQFPHKNTKKLIEFASVRRIGVFFVRLWVGVGSSRLCYALKYLFQTISVCANTVAAIIIINFVECARCSQVTRTHNTYFVFTTVPLANPGINVAPAAHHTFTSSTNENELSESGRA